jgi:Kae1-associated kinase Bud32
MTSEPPPAESSRSWIGRRVRSYEVVSRIGRGGMGEVYRARDTKLGREVALKVLPEEFARDPHRLKRFEQEARSASALNHPNIITVYDIDEHDSTPFIAMEYVEGQTLREILRGGPLPTRRLVHLATQMAEGLAKAHSAGIVHRDLKPENVMVTADGFVKILDFGLAKLTHEAVTEGSDVTTMTRELTREGAIVGTLGYMSPEQASGRPVDHRSDQFSFGAILYELATGTIAFKRETAAQTLAAVIEGAPRPIAKVNPKVPARLRGIVERCLSKEPSERYESTRDLAKELERLRGSLQEAPAILTRRTALAGVAALVTVVLAALLAWNIEGFRDRRSGGAEPARIDSLAVLPLKNLSSDTEQEYFVDGITEALMTDLAKISALKVIARDSAMQYKGTDKPIREIARELGVDAVITGSVLRSGDRVRVTAQLIEAETDQYLWAETFDRELRDILALYSDVARAIAHEIEITITPEERTRLATTRVVDPEAYPLWLKGNFHLLNFNEESFRKALQAYQEATAIDPAYAPAYAGMAMAYIALGGWQASEPPQKVFPLAKAAAERALALDADVAEAHIALARIRQFEWDWRGADRAFARGIALDPGTTWARMVYANFLTAMGRFEESIEIGRRTLEQDPLSPLAYNELAFALQFAGQGQEALRLYREGLDLAPDFPQSHILLAMLYDRRDEYDPALTHVAALRPLLDALPPYLQAIVGRIYGRAGRRPEALDVLSRLRHRRVESYVPAGALALVHLGLGQNEEALGWLERAHEERNVGLVWLNVGWEYDPLRSDPRFQAILDAMDFPHRDVARSSG